MGPPLWRPQAGRRAPVTVPWLGARRKRRGQRETFAADGGCETRRMQELLPYLQRRGVRLPCGERRGGEMNWGVKAVQAALAWPSGGERRCRFLRWAVQRFGVRRWAAVRGRS